MSTSQHGNDVPELFDLEDEAANLLMTAEWRRAKAKEYPDDERNLQAAAQLEKLAAGISAMTGSISHLKLDARLRDDDLFKFGRRYPTIGGRSGSLNFQRLVVKLQKSKQPTSCRRSTDA